MGLRPLGDRLIVREIPPVEVSAGGVVLPDAAQEKTQRATVVAVGRGFSVQELEGVVVFSKYGGTELTVDGEELLVLRESDVLAVEVSE